MEEHHGKRRRKQEKNQYCTDFPEEILDLRALQGHSGRNLIDPSLQDNASIPNDFFEYIYHIVCAISLHSIVNSGLIPPGQNSTRERQTVFFTAVNPMNKDHKDPDVINLDAPRLYQTRSNVIILYDTLPAYCIPKAIMMGSGEVIFEKVYASLRPPPKISFKDNWMKELGSEVAGSSKDTQRIQPKSKTQLSRTGRHVLAEQPSGSSAQEIDKRVLLDCESTNVRTGRLVFQLCASVC